MSLLEIDSGKRSSGQVQPDEATRRFQPWIISSSVNCRILLQVALIFLFAFPRSSVWGFQLPNIYWNSSNPIFRIDNTDHIIDVNKSPGEYDRVNIYCPRMTTTTAFGETDSLQINKRRAAQDGYYIIYNVSKEEYETCRITNPNARRMLVCDNPLSDRLSYVTITFRPFTPQPNGPEFHAGQDYYFISTSTGSENGLDNKIGGRCIADNMKLVFKVAGKEAPAGLDSDEQVNMKKVIQAQSPQTTFRLPFRERLPAYETMDEERPLVSPTTIPFFFRPRTTPYRPRIMKFTPKPPSMPVNVIDSENNDLPAAEVRPSVTDDASRSGNVGKLLRTTTNDYFNVIREEDAAVPARQTKPRPAYMNATSTCRSWMPILILLTTILGMLQTL